MSTKETACEEELTEIKTDQGKVITKSERFLSLSLKQSKKGNRKCVRLYLYRLFEDLRSLWSITDIIVLYILNIKALRCCCNVRRISGPTLTTADYIVPQSGELCVCEPQRNKYNSLRCLGGILVFAKVISKLSFERKHVSEVEDNAAFYMLSDRSLISWLCEPRRIDCVSSSAAKRRKIDLRFDSLLNTFSWTVKWKGCSLCALFPQRFRGYGEDVFSWI